MGSLQLDRRRVNSPDSLPPIPRDDEAERGLVGNLLYRRAPQDCDLREIVFDELRRALAVALVYHRSHCWQRSQSQCVAHIEAAASQNASRVARSVALVGIWSAEAALHELYVECRTVAAHGIYRTEYWLRRLERAADKRRKLALAERLMREALA